MALEWVQKLRPIAYPNSGFMEKLRDFKDNLILIDSDNNAVEEIKSKSNRKFKFYNSNGNGKNKNL